MDNADPDKNHKLYRQWIAALTATLGLFMMGMFVGWSSAVLATLRSPDSTVRLSEAQISWTVSVLYIGSTVSPVPTGWLMDVVGRKYTLMLLASTAVASWAILVLVHDPTGIYVARFLGGLWGGSVYTVAPVYLCEIAEAKVRGGLNSLFILMAYTGVLFEYVLGPRLPYTTLSLVSLAVPLVFVVAMACVPESPYFCLMREDRRRAREALVWLRCASSSDQVEEELAAMERAVLADRQSRGLPPDLFSSSGRRRALLVTVMLAVLQRMSGVSVIMAYASAAMPQTWGLAPSDCAVLLCVDWILFGLASTFLLDRAGRRPLLVISCTGCALANAILSLWFFLDSDTSYDALSISWFPLVGFVLYGACFPVGLGCVPNTVQGELFPSSTRGLASGVTSTLISLTSFLSNKMYFLVGEWVGVYLNYAVFSACCLFGVYFAVAVVVETKGKTLEQIQTQLEAVCARRREKHVVHEVQRLNQI